MASRFSTTDVAPLSRKQKMEALGIALRWKAGHIHWDVPRSHSPGHPDLPLEPVS